MCIVNDFLGLTLPSYFCASPLVSTETASFQGVVVLGFHEEYLQTYSTTIFKIPMKILLYFRKRDKKLKIH